ncbi:MAG: nucleotide sugar dehydrogenase [Deltaproteobacteria bacterium HGW-Deltaproteobacteria-2]|jgi:UDP-N-acetyl-D-galactosamine dehydrogenase|nr:MAG: nucleotide sugar dehydrogenase [Deltaproteobacteria bacterium HGW-Deltaproteobacteria-2]
MKQTLTAQTFFAGKNKIAVIGLGYVGLPLAAHLSRHFKVIGFDINEEIVLELKKSHDRTMELSDTELKKSKIIFTSRQSDLSSSKLFIVAVPTPVDHFHVPDLGAIENASAIIGRQMSSGSCVVYESTVYPGVTEDICVPILERESKLKFGRDFTVGYSPERINPGDKIHTISNTTKIISASDAATLNLLEGIYSAVVKVNLHRVSSIKVAEAAKVIENTQRDINIALMNELAIIFNRMGIDTLEVLEAAGTKWNFLSFRPGLVGGHCIGVDPYYLTYKAESIGYRPEVILAGRRINDNMGKYVAQKAIKMMIASDIQVNKARVAVLGLSFKENVPDLRNTRVIDIIKELNDYGVEVLVHDPLADPDEARQHYNIELTSLRKIKNVDAVVLAVAHNNYKEIGLSRIAGLCRKNFPILLDIKAIFEPEKARSSGINYWRL